MELTGGFDTSAESIPTNSKEQVVLVILDGWGIAPKNNYNAIGIARKPNFDSIEKEFDETQLCASGTCVGLTEGQMGNSEVGHLTIGAGRIIFQDLMRVFEEIRSGRLQRNDILLTAFKAARIKGSTVHFLGLLSDGGVHSHIEHLFTLLKIAKSAGIEKIAIHAILDGRDTSPMSGVLYITSLQSYLTSLQCGTLQTISGRFYSMDRDNRWDRIKLAYDAIVYGEGEKFENATKAVEQSYAKGTTDEFVLPQVHQGYQGMRDNDLVVFFNFRPDRARQLTKALSFSYDEFDSTFDRKESARPKHLEVISMTVYDPNYTSVKALLGQEHVPHTLSDVLEMQAIPQLRIAETEKYAHVTYFFNGLVEKPRRLEERILVPSLKVGTYDKSPQMSAREITEEALKALRSRNYGFILINFANADMVGHSGNVPATVKAVETVDECIGKIVEAWRAISDYTSLIITSDHGNAEKMYDEKTAQPHTAHTSNLVPFILISKKWKIDAHEGDKLGLKDVAPSILEMLGLVKPEAMTGQSFIHLRPK